MMYGPYISNQHEKFLLHTEIVYDHRWSFEFDTRSCEQVQDYLKKNCKIRVRSKPLNEHTLDVLTSYKDCLSPEGVSWFCPIIRQIHCHRKKSKICLWSIIIIKSFFVTQRLLMTFGCVLIWTQVYLCNFKVIGKKISFCFGL